MSKNYPHPEMRSIPGYREIEFPNAVNVQRLMQFRPYVRQSGNTLRGPWHLATRRLLDFLLVYVGSGNGRFTVNGRTFEVKADDLIWVPPDTPHEMRGFSPKMHCVYLHFDVRYSPERSHWDACIPGGVMDLMPWKEFMHPPVSDPVLGQLCGKLNGENVGRIRTRMENICRVHRSGRDGADAMLSGMMLELLMEIIGGVTTTAPMPFHHHKLREAAEFIKENAEKGFCSKQLARRCSLSESHFRKLFRELHGITPAAMRRQQVMKKACELLVYSDKPISEIAEILGFHSIYAFSRAFTATMRISPRQYRKGQTPPFVAL